MDSLSAFIEYSAKLKGDERSESQNFLEHLFQAFGHKSLIESGIILEDRIKKPKGKGKKFADLVWPGRTLIEMKSRGVNLAKHYLQAQEYWMQLTGHRPRWVVLCNFDEFWIYDYEANVNEPADKIFLVNLCDQAVSLSFLKPAYEQPVFGVNRVSVTQQAADLVVGAFNSMINREIDREKAQRYILQCVVALFSEDLDLLPRDLFTRLLKTCLDSTNPSSESFDLIGGLFRQMNNREGVVGGRYKGVRFFNGGLFSTVNPVELTEKEISALYEAAKQNWSEVNPAIFGTIFQHSMGKEERHAFGAHYTSEADIMKVVNPTIVRPWRKRLEETKTLTEMIELWDALSKYKILDPACGSGNFLYVAFRELKRIETDLLIKMRGSFKKAQSFTRGFLSPRQFYGFDTLPFAVELAKVTILLAKEIGIVEQATAIEAEDGVRWLDLDPALPLDNLDNNIRQEDALFVEWPNADAIIGNPPYLDARKLTMERGRPYSKKVRKAFPGVPGRADYCVHWFRKAHDCLSNGQRAGLVGTNSIRQNYSRQGGLDYIIANGGTITEAISNQDWSGDANVEVSIVNWIKGSENGPFVVHTQDVESKGKPWRRTELPHINAALSETTDLGKAINLLVASNPKVVFEGQQTGHIGFVIDETRKKFFSSRDLSWHEVLFPYVNGDDLLGGVYLTSPTWLIDFDEMDLFDASKHKNILDYIQETVLPDWKNNADKELKETGKTTGEHQNRIKTWWLLKRRRSDMLDSISRITRYIAISAVSKRPIFSFLSKEIRPSNAIKVFTLEDDYSFGVLQSTLFWEWIKGRGSSLTTRTRFTPDTAFKSFPWPQRPEKYAIERVSKNAVALRILREEIQEKNGLCLRDLYRLAEKPGGNSLKDAQKNLDESVSAAYGISKNEDALEFLLKLNLECAEKEAKGQEIVGPGLPKWVENREDFVSEDCIRMV